jgi:hypothetical protein
MIDLFLHQVAPAIIAGPGLEGIMLKRLVAVAAVVVAGVGSANATQIGRVGLDSCGAWTQAHQTHSPVRLLMEQWIAGWLDRANSSPDLDILEGEDWFGTMAWIDSWCAAHPLDKLSSVAGALEQE